MPQQEQTVPTLRFSEFNCEWEHHRIDDLFSIGAGGDIDKTRYSPHKSPEYPYPVFANSNENKGLYGYTSYYKEEAHCVTVSGRGHLGVPVARHERFVPIVRLLVLRPKHESDISFYEAGISRINFFVESTGVPQLTGPQISSYKITTTTYEEQQKIAAFLGAVDEKIAQLQKKKDLLEDYKKGCMQKLFSQDLRFKDDNGNAFLDWGETTLGKNVTTKTGDSNREDSTEEGEYVFFDRSNDVRASSKYLFDCEAIIVAGEGKDFPPKYFFGKFDLHQRAYAITSFGNNVGKFLYYWIHKHRQHFLKYAVGSTMPSLRMNAFDKFPVNLPHPDEQKKIANFLSAIDDKIALVTEELNKSKIFKKGLLQQMFV